MQSIDPTHSVTALQDSVPSILPVRICVRACERRKKMAHVMAFLSKVNGKFENRSPYQGVVKRDWVPTGRIDFATHLNGDAEAADQPNEFKLLVEERRIVESIAGNENLEIQWRLATLKEAKAVVTQYHKYLSEHSLIKSLVDETALLSPPIPAQGHRSDPD